ncbi:hypothetical protein DNTS_014378 [Danionella cerebrum]|uniref:Uncharacterized protein n=1 Tax=Danionella cerebrum TaxID=2873325 RepID=A0A553RQS5_9TELE|nr:hypothetical protein DNTS_014378 [Danionella translucida]
MDYFSTIITGASGLLLLHAFHSIYFTHISFKTQTVFDSQHLPGSFYLLIRCIYQSILKKRGEIMIEQTNEELILSVINCRFDDKSLKSFCAHSGYGWDYPDSDFRDTPLCFPKFLFSKLIAMIQCSERFRLSPSGLLCVRECVTLLEAVDELKRGPFTLEARVNGYRMESTGVEVELSLTASRLQRCIWSSTLTLLSPINTKMPRAQTSLPISHDPKWEWCISLSAPRRTGVSCVWAFCDLWALCGLTRHNLHTLWMFSRCMAEMEKHRGVEVVRAPLTVSVYYHLPVSSSSGKFCIRMCENSSEKSRTAWFSLADQKSRVLCISGQIKQQTSEKAR